MGTIFTCEFGPTSINSEVKIKIIQNDSGIELNNITGPNEVDVEDNKICINNPDYVIATEESTSSQEQYDTTENTNKVGIQENPEFALSEGNTTQRNKNAKIESWKQNKNKYLRMKGKEYLGYNKIGNKYNLEKNLF